MKKILARTLLSVLLILGLMLGGCSEVSPGVSDRPEGGPDEQIRSEKEDVPDTNADTDSGSAGADSPDQAGIPFAASYIRTDGYNEETIYPVITLISSRGELDSYYAENCEKYHLGHREKIYSDSTVGFADACEKYDDGFFREHSLILVLVEEGSGSVRHEITAVSAGDGGSVTVDIVRSVPEEMTDDMAEWHIIIEISKEDLPEPPGEIYLRDQGGVSVTTSPVNVTAGNGCGRVSLKVPRTWTYEISEDKDKDTAVISISPRGCRGSIDIRYGAEMYGVCGTGLEEKDIMLGSHQAWQGFYDHGSVWSFMILKDLPVGYMFIGLNDDGNWYGQYEDEAMEILGTIEVEPVFWFSHQWGVYGIRNYDSRSGKLIKTTDTDEVEKYTAVYEMPADEATRIYRILRSLGIENYPDIIYPYGENYFSEPSGMIVLTVRTADLYKTVTIRNIPPYTTEMMLNDVNPTASEPDKAFLRACLDIENILMSSEEWSSIPDPDKMYE